MDSVEQLGRYTLTQREGCFKLGVDSLQLAQFATVRPRWSVCDLGCGSGALLLLLLEREVSLQVTGVELHPGAVQLARENLTQNGILGQILSGDLGQRLVPAGQFDLVVSNPPYFAQGTGKSGGITRMEATCTLLSLCQSASYALRNGGRFALVYRPERLDDLLSTMTQTGIQPKRLQLLQHNSQKPPFALLVEGVKQGRPGLDVLPTKVLCPWM